MKPIATAILGTGFMGRVHLEAVRRVENVTPMAIFGRNPDAAHRLGTGFSVPKITTDYHEIMQDRAVDAVHICTPNAQHFSMAKEALLAGKHVLCEKPLTTAVEESEELVSLAAKHGLRNCVCHNLRYYPQVQQMRRMREAGDLGEILVVQGTYSQDWLLYDTDWNWRVDAKASGASRAMADIGSHFFDGRTRDRPARHFPLRRSPNLPQDTQAAQTFCRNFRQQADGPGRLHRDSSRN